MHLHQKPNFVIEYQTYNQLNMDNERLELLASRYNLPTEFLKEFWDKVIDKQNFEFGIKMFIDGWITYDIAIGSQPININEHQKKYLATITQK